MDAFYTLKNNPVFIIVQSCCCTFPKEPALGSAELQIARQQRGLQNKSPTFTKLSLLERCHILEPQYFQIRHFQALGFPSVHQEYLKYSYQAATLR